FGYNTIWDNHSSFVKCSNGRFLFSVISKNKELIPSKNSIIPLIFSGIMDTVGNGAFALSSQLGRLDIASILGSLYPAFTVILAWFFLREKISKIQFFGLILALTACILISI
ncbi:MAG: DMT family transporter, partial [Chloroflexota bacterium]